MLGSSGAWPIPRLGCDCAQCTSPDERDRRLRSSLLIDGRILVDAGPDAYHQLQRAEAMPEAVLLTHHHYDHILGLHVLSKAGRMPLHLTKETEKGVRAIFPRIDFRVMHLTPGVKLELGNGLVAQAFDVPHSENTRTVAFRFSSDTGGGSLVYAPDLAGPPESKLAKGASVLVLDGSSRDTRQGGHMPMTEGLAVARSLKPGRTVFTHIGHRMGTQVELEAWMAGRAEVAYDGMEIEF
ncbi:MAG: phosphoribosyl 1,2-cyclic phosphate phosphodiesterase [Gaiellales bacterium]|nr:phosphoribosyl 1,2-cyclic phosphate phosphodiesterase [Gaiellales bacterium]